jgi:hypothetical protein
MAAPTHTGEGRALSAALSAPAPFVSRASAMALHASDRHVDRWAPEREATRRSRSLGALSFVDRLLTPWMTAAQPTVLAGASRPMNVRTPTSWVFPRPWYQDELDWMAAAREADDQGRSGLLTTRGTYALPSAVAHAPMAASVRSAGQTIVVMADQLPRVAAAPDAPSAIATGYSYVAPSLAAPGARARSPEISVAAPGPLRAWSPQVSFAAAQAAEVMAATVAIAEDAGLTVAERSPVLEGLSYVTPAQVALPDEAPASGGRGAPPAPTL